MVNEFSKRKFNATVCMEFQVCFTLAKYTNDMLSFCETTNVFIDAFVFNSKIHFHQLGPFKLIKTMLKSFVTFISSVESLSKGSHNTWAT